jgi:hypothetical protein
VQAEASRWAVIRNPSQKRKPHRYSSLIC